MVDGVGEEGECRCRVLRLVEEREKFQWRRPALELPVPVGAERPPLAKREAESCLRLYPHHVQSYDL